MESGTTFKLRYGDYCKVTGLENGQDTEKIGANCLIEGTGLKNVYVGLSSWISQEGTIYQEQEKFCRSIESFSVNIQSHHPLYIIRQFSN